MTIAYITLGCKLNYAETSTWRRAFEAAGWTTVPASAAADFYLVNTCAVTTHSENKGRNLIRRCHRTAPQAAIIVTGCYAQLRRKEVAALEGVRLVFGTAEKGELVARTLAWAAAKGPSGNQPDGHVPAENRSDARGEVLTQTTFRAEDPAARAASYKAISQSTFGAWSTGDRVRSFLKVQDGCNNFCAYCTVPFARGESRNIPVCEAVRAAREIAASGRREIVLTGVNTGDFGRTTGETFPQLLRALLDVEGIGRWRISSIEPNLLTDEVIDLLAASEKFQPHFHIPLQSGCDALLERVGRHYDTAFFAGRLARVRKAFAAAGRSPVFFGIDVIVGLPGETEERFEETVRFLESIRPAFLHIFPYSPRPGTRAAAWPDQVQDRIKTERVARLEALSDRLHAAFAAANAGRREQVLWEGSVKSAEGLLVCRDVEQDADAGNARPVRWMAGYTGNYLRLARPYRAELIGTVTDEVVPQ